MIYFWYNDFCHITETALVEEAEKAAFSSTVGYTPPVRGRGRGRRRGRGRGAKGEQWWLDKQQKKKEEKNKAK